MSALSPYDAPSRWQWRKQKASRRKPFTKNHAWVPSSSEYVLEGTKISLDLLKCVANMVPLPYVSLVVESASRLLGASEQIYANRERLEALKERVCALILIMIAPHRGKKCEEIPQDLESDLKQFKSELEQITDVLEKIAEQNFWRSMLLNGVNLGKIQDCYSQLDASMQKFEVSRQICNTVRLCESLDVAKENLIVTKNMLNITQTGFDLARENQNMLDAVSKRIMEDQQHINAAPKSRIMPSRPLIFHGRESVVKDIARRITAAGNPHIAILGPGGMGKTSVALAVLERDEVKAKFSDNCFWVPCVEATTPAILLEVIAKSLRITQFSGDHLSDIISELESSSDPRVILLDNFETPWDWHGPGSNVEDCLCALAKVPHVAILLTMRCSKPPSHKVVWDKLDDATLPELDVSAAHQVYVDIHPAAHADPQLASLLKALGHMPLAITLMASLGLNSETMPTQLLENWNNPSIRADLLPDGSGSINISVRLSIENPHMRANPKAVTLLAILSMLPGGARRDFLPQLAPSIINIPKALDALTKSALAEIRSNTQCDIPYIHVQPVVAAYVLTHHPLDPDVLKDVYQAYCDFVNHHKVKPGDLKFIDNARALAREESNIQAILFAAVESKESAEAALNALVSFSWYQYWTIPRIEVVERAVEAAKAAKLERTVAEGLHCYGSTLQVLDRYADACRALEEGRATFQSLNEPRRAAQCLLKLGETYWYVQRDDRRASNIAEEALREFQSLGDEHGRVESMLLLGQSKTYQRRADARSILKAAREEFLRQAQPLHAAHCLYFLAKTDYFEDNYARSLQVCFEARGEYRRLADALNTARCHINIGWCQKELFLYSDALETFKVGLDEYLRLGRPLGIAQCLEGVGHAHKGLSQYDLACASYQKSLQHFQRVDSVTSRIEARRSSTGHNECLQMLERDRGKSQSSDPRPDFTNNKVVDV